jgi:hypothetical protein
MTCKAHACQTRSASLRVEAPFSFLARAAACAVPRSAAVVMDGAPAAHASAVCALELPVEALEHAKGPFFGPQHPAPGVMNHERCFAHHLLDHRLDAPAFGTVAYRRVRSRQRDLSDQAQHVELHRVVGVELARGHTLQIHV